MTTAIMTKYIGATNHRGARIKATAMSAGGPYVVVSYDYAHGQTGNHDRAAQELAAQLRWDGCWVGGDHTTGRAYVRLPLNAVAMSNAAFSVTEGRPQGRTVARRAG